MEPHSGILQAWSLEIIPRPAQKTCWFQREGCSQLEALDMPACKKDFHCQEVFFARSLLSNPGCQSRLRSLQQKPRTSTVRIPEILIRDLLPRICISAHFRSSHHISSSISTKIQTYTYPLLRTGRWSWTDGAAPSFCKGSFAVHCRGAARGSKERLHVRL